MGRHGQALAVRSPHNFRRKNTAPAFRRGECFCDNVCRKLRDAMKSAWIFASAFAALSFSALGQTGAIPALYSFTISDAESWTDTGVDLAIGDSLSITAETKAGSDTNCSPAGFNVIAGNPGTIPLPASPPGA